MTALMNGYIQGQNVILDREIPQQYDGATVSVYINTPHEMTIEERIEAIKQLSLKGGRVFPDDVVGYIRSIRDDDR